jgi:hypothetical protein
LPPGLARTTARTLSVASVAIVVGAALPLYVTELGTSLDCAQPWSALVLAALLAWISTILRARTMPEPDH